MDLDTFLTQLYVMIHDWYKTEMAGGMARRRGPAVKLSDSEVLTIALVGQWRVGVLWRSERGVVPADAGTQPVQCACAGVVGCVRSFATSDCGMVIHG